MLLHVTIGIGSIAEYGVTKYEIGSGLNHFGLTVPNVSVRNPKICVSDDSLPLNLFLKQMFVCFVCFVCSFKIEAYDV